MAATGDIPADLGQTIRENGWMQGDVFPAAAHSSLNQHFDKNLSDTDCCIVVSQSCDIVYSDEVAEPFVEVVLARRSESESKGAFRNLKSPRRLQFDVELGGTSHEFEAVAADRRAIPRRILAAHQPDNHRRVSDEGLEDLIRWLVARYERRAFPDAFNARWAVRERQVRKTWMKMKAIHSIYVALHSYEELDGASPYRLSVVGAMRSNRYEDPARRGEMEARLSDFVQELNRCAGISVEDFQVKSERDITLEDTRMYSRWYLDSVSLRDRLHDLPPASVG